VKAARCIVCRCALTSDNVVPFRLRGRVVFASCRDHEGHVTKSVALLGQLAGTAAHAAIDAYAPKLVREVRKLSRKLAKAAPALLPWRS